MTFSRWMTGVALAAFLSVPAAAAQPQDKAEVALRAAMEKETVEGDVKGAIEQYKKLAQNSNKSVAARALVRLGECYEKLGDAEARKAYEQVLSKFGDQTEAVAQARARLAAMGGEGSGSGLRLIDKDGRLISASPDGRLLLTWGADTGVDLRDVRTGQVRSLVKGLAWGATFSPDGRQIAFMRDADNTELRLVGVDGSAERLLWKPDKGWTEEAWWFPDGRRILVSVYLDDGVNRLVAVSATDGAATTLWEGKGFFSGQLSPDGRSVAFRRRVSEDPIVEDLRLLTLADRNESTLLQWQSLIGYPVWTPDGAGVVFPSDRRSPGAAVDLWLLRVSGGKPLGTAELIRKDIGGATQGRISVYSPGPITRDGALYFRRGQTGGGMAQLMTTQFDPETGKAVGTPAFVSRMGGDQRSPSFSRDGRWLAYTVQNPARVFNLVVQSVESGEERVVPMDPKPVQLGGAVMFPDGRSVLVGATHPKDGRGFYRVDVATGAWTSLKKPGEKGAVWGEMGGGGISPDGKTIYFCRSQSSLTDPYGRPPLPLIARDIETGQEREVTRLLPSWTFGLALDGTQLAVGNKDGNDLVLKIVPTAGGTSREIFRDSTSRIFGAPVWMPDGQNLIFEASRTSLGDNTGYMIVPVAGGAARSIGIAPSQEGQFPLTFGAVRVHPNGHQLVYVARSGKGPYNAEYETWVLENFLPAAKTAK